MDGSRIKKQNVVKKHQGAGSGDRSRALGETSRRKAKQKASGIRGVDAEKDAEAAHYQVSWLNSLPCRSMRVFANNADFSYIIRINGCCHS